MSAFNDPCVPDDDDHCICLPAGTDTTGVDLTRHVVVHPFEGINWTGCAEDMPASDINLDGRLGVREYETFVQRTAARRCLDWPRLWLGQFGDYSSLACQCVIRQRNNNALRPNVFRDFSCCIGANAHLPVITFDPDVVADDWQADFFKDVCQRTYDGLPRTNCSIKVISLPDDHVFSPSAQPSLSAEPSMSEEPSVSPEPSISQEPSLSQEPSASASQEPSTTRESFQPLAGATAKTAQNVDPPPKISKNQNQPITSGSMMRAIPGDISLVWWLAGAAMLQMFWSG